MNRSVAREAIARIGTASWLIPERIDQEELLDLGEGTICDAEASLNDMWRINRFLGGFRAITQHLYPRLCAHSDIATILDLGTGSAQLATALAHWAKRHQLAVHIVATDINTRNLTIAQDVTRGEPNIQLIQMDAGRLPLAENSVDYLISSLLLHHLSPEQVVTLLRDAFTCARRGIIFSDIKRGWLPWVGFKLGQPVFVRSYLTRYDGAISVLRAYTPTELKQLAQAAGLTNVRVFSHPLWRMTLTADKS